MPFENGYSIYIAAPSRQRASWIVRVYRDSDDRHIHSAEGCDILSIGMREAEKAITADVNERLAAR
jgi:hypothetical protein